MVELIAYGILLVLCIGAMISVTRDGGYGDKRISHQTHKEMMEEESRHKHQDVYAITFEEFLELYQSRDWYRQPSFPFSHFATGSYGDGEWYIHAGIIILDGKLRWFKKWKDYKKFYKWERMYEFKSEKSYGLKE